LPNPIDSYRVGDDGLIHFYAGQDHVVSAPVDSHQARAKAAELGAGKRDMRPVSTADAPSDYAAGWRGVSLQDSMAPPQAPTGPAYSFSAPPMRPVAPSPAQVSAAASAGALQGAARPPPEALLAAASRGALQGGARPPPGPSMPMGAAPPVMPPVNLNDLDEAYRRAQLDTGARFR